MNMDDYMRLFTPLYDEIFERGGPDYTWKEMEINAKCFKFYGKLMWIYCACSHPCNRCSVSFFLFVVCTSTRICKFMCTLHHEDIINSRHCESQWFTPPKTNSSHLQQLPNPKRKACLPTINDFRSYILLMEEILHHLACKNPWKSYE